MFSCPSHLLNLSRVQYSAKSVAVMAPKKAAPVKDTPARRGRPTKAVSAAKQTAAEERAEQEIAAEPTARQTRSRISPKEPVTATPITKAAAKRKVTKTSTVRPKPVAKPSSRAKARGNAEYEDDEDNEAATPETKQKRGAATGSKQPNPFTPGAFPVLSSETSTAKKAKAPKGLSPAAQKKQLTAKIEQDAYEAVLKGDFEAKSSVVHSDYPLVSKTVFNNRKNAGLVRGMEERKRLLKAKTSTSGPRPMTPKPKDTTQIIQKTPDPDHADARKQAEDERIRLLQERRDIMKKEKPYSTTIDTEIVEGAPMSSKRGNYESSTNPGIIKILVDKSKPDEWQERVNPFYETLPGPEVWHRNMPPFFSFGETKFMQQYISDEINRDLARRKLSLGPSIHSTDGVLT